MQFYIHNYIHKSLTKILQNIYYNPHFTHKDTEAQRLDNLFKIIKLVGGRTNIQVQVCLLQELFS